MLTNIQIWPALSTRASCPPNSAGIFDVAQTTTPSRIDRHEYARTPRVVYKDDAARTRCYCNQCPVPFAACTGVRVLPDAPLNFLCAVYLGSCQLGASLL